MKKYIRFMYLSPFLLALLCGCSELYLRDFLSQQKKIEVYIDHSALSSVLQSKDDISWNLSWYDECGVLHKKEHCTSSEKITLLEDYVTPIIATPVLLHCPIQVEPEECAGGLFPFDAKGAGEVKTISMHPKKGGVARTMELVLCRADGAYHTGEFIASHFNWNRFDSKVQTLTNSQWLDTELAASSILSGKFTTYRIKERNRTAVKFSIQDARILPGTVFYQMWHNEIAFEWPENSTISIELPEGLFHFFSHSGYISIQVKKSKSLCSFYTPYLLQE